MNKQYLDDLFMAARLNPKNPMNQPGKAMGKHIAARIARAKAKRAKGRVKKGRRTSKGASYTL